MHKIENSNQVILKINNLTICFPGNFGIINALENVSIEVRKGANLGIIGESGSGKTVLSLAMAGIVDEPGRVTSGEVLIYGKDILTLPEDKKREIRRRKISIILSDPYCSFDPLFTIGSQIMELIGLKQKLSRKEARDLCIELLNRVGIPSPKSRLADYPFQFSGGMLQRVSIAMAISSNPEMIIADNPTQALDVTVQAQILLLLDELQQKMNTTVILISNNLPVVSSMVQEIIVLSQGKIVESGLKHDILKNSKHQYTQALVKSIPSFTGDRLERLPTLRISSQARIKDMI